MKMFLRVFLIVISLLTAGSAFGQQGAFELTGAKVGQKYDTNIIKVLRENYDQVLQSNSDEPDFRWSLSSGVLPEGLRLLGSGRIAGIPQQSRNAPYNFRVSVVDEASTDAQPLEISLSLKVSGQAKKSAQLRLRPASEAPDTNDESTEREPQRGDAVTISAADKLPPRQSKAQVAFTKNNNDVAYLLVIGSQGNLLKRIKEIATTKTVTDELELQNGKNIIRVLAFDAQDNKVGPDVTKEIITSDLQPRTEAVILSEPFKTDNISDLPLKVKLIDQQDIMAKLTFEVTTPDGAVVDEGRSAVDKAQDPQQLLIRIRNGKNNISVRAFTADNVPVAEDNTVIECTEKCGAVTDASISLSDPFTVTDDSVAKLTITPSDEKKKLLSYSYKVVDKNGDSHSGSEPARVATNGTRVPQEILIDQLAEGTNTVYVTGMTKDGDKDVPITKTKNTTITCINCKGNSLAQSGSSVYTRAILGFEQSGASSSDSAQKPFLDFFFGAPIGGKQSEAIPPRLATWGQVRFASVPQQQLASNNTLQNFSTGFLTTVQGLKVNELVQGFDFLAGLDVRLIKPGGKGFVDLDPGTRQKTSVSFIAAFGAINPFTQRQTAQVFLIPKINGMTDPAFLKQFPEAENKTNIAFVSPERDRFYRQYYGGFRFKTFFYDKHGEIINRFPALLDVTFGQNELVTGKLRNAIFRLEGFYPLPFKSARFFYLYGTAMMKIGGGGVKTTLPLQLTATTVQLPDANTVVVPIDRNPSLRSTRDYYRFGMGINLIELLDKLKAPTSQ